MAPNLVFFASFGPRFFAISGRGPFSIFGHVFPFSDFGPFSILTMWPDSQKLPECNCILRSVLGNCRIVIAISAGDALRESSSAEKNIDREGPRDQNRHILTM